MPATLAVTGTSASVALAELHNGIFHIANDGPNDAYILVGASPQTATPTTGTLVKAYMIVMMGAGASSNVVAAITAAPGLTATLRISSPGYGATT